MCAELVVFIFDYIFLVLLSFYIFIFKIHTYNNP